MDIQDIARLAKVSTATVSRVLNKSASVRPQTAQRVQRVVDKMGYIPNRNARNLRVRHSKLYGLIVSDVKNPFFPDLIDGFEALAAAHGIDVIFTHTNYDPERLGHCLRRMAERNVDAIAVMTSEINLSALQRIRSLKIPVVLLDQTSTGSSFPNVLTDFDSGLMKALRHLRDLGHSQIGFLAGPSGFDSVSRRRDAFIAAMKKLRLKVHPKWIVTGALTISGGSSAMEALLEMPSRPTAIMTTNDQMALGALQAAHRAHLDVPRDLSIIGFDDLPVSTILNPALTTISLSRLEIAERAFSFLHRKPRNNPSPIHPNLIVRETTAPPPKPR